MNPDPPTVESVRLRVVGDRVRILEVHGSEVILPSDEDITLDSGDVVIGMHVNQVDFSVGPV